MKNFNYLLPLIPFVFLAFLAYSVYQKFFKKTISSLDEERIKEQSLLFLSNGTSYIQAAKFLFESMFSGGFAGDLFFNVDEKAVGSFMLNVKASEYRNLESVYSEVKKDLLPMITVSRGGTLTDDLNKCFNKSEKKEYLSHLNIL